MLHRTRWSMGRWGLSCAPDFMVVFRASYDPSTVKYMRPIVQNHESLKKSMVFQNLCENSIVDL